MHLRTPTTDEDPGYEAAGNAPRLDPPATGWFREFGVFLLTHTAWWAIPLGVAIAAVALLAWLTREPARPPTYPYF